MKALFLLALLTSPALCQVSNDPFGDKDMTSPEISKVDGLWERDGKNLKAIKHFYVGRFNLSYINPATSVVTSHMIGIFAFQEGRLKEKGKFVTEDWDDYCNHPRQSPIGFEGESIYSQFSLDGHKEVWMRQNALPAVRTLGAVADFSNDLTDLDGTWLIEYAERRGLKIYDRGRFSFTVFEMKSKRIISHEMGIYSFDGRIIREKILYATAGRKQLIGTTAPLKVEWKGQGKMMQTDTKGTNDDWQRVGEKPKKAKFTGVDSKKK